MCWFMIQWSSDAFLLYVQKQVKEFTKGIANFMTLNEIYFTIFSQHTNPEDPCSLNASYSFVMATQIGSNAI